jgi:hypothetical protein
MGYSTDFEGEIKVEPPLNAEEIAFLNKFSETRRMHRHNGPYFVDGAGYAGQEHSPDVIGYNDPPPGQPSLWCQWVPTEDGSAIHWNGVEKFNSGYEWMTYLIDHFLKPGHIAPLPFLGEHVLNGEILAQGEDIHDRWKLRVVNNVVSKIELE